MNINLSSSTSQKRTIGFGLNKRGGNVAKKKKKQPKKSSIFDDDGDSDDYGEKGKFGQIGDSSLRGGGGDPSRSSFNRELAAEQRVLRQKAEKAMVSAVSSNVYNYDAEYESFSASAAASRQEQQQKQEPKERKSKYISKLLAVAKDRKQEQEILLERKIAREQAAEEQNQEYMGKEKFVTKSYKRKLEEREQWLKNDTEAQKMEEREDVRKKVGGHAMMGLDWGEMGSSRKMSSSAHVLDAKQPVQDDYQTYSSSVTAEKGRIDHNNISGKRLDHNHDHHYRRVETTAHPDHTEHYEEDAEEVKLDEELAEQAKQAKRLEKILAARERYLKRRGHLKSCSMMQTS